MRRSWPSASARRGDRRVRRRRQPQGAPAALGAAAAGGLRAGGHLGEHLPKPPSCCAPSIRVDRAAARRRLHRRGLSCRRRPRPARRLLPGSSIGNFEPPWAVRLLERYRRWLQGGGLLVGGTWVKSHRHAAARGLQRCAGRDGRLQPEPAGARQPRARRRFRPAKWEHAAHYQPLAAAHRDAPVSRRAQQVRLGGERFHFDEGESIHTENSYRVQRGRIPGPGARAGAPQAVWIDGARVSLHWLQPASTETVGRPVATPAGRSSWMQR